MSLRIRFAIGMAAMLLPLVLSVVVGHFYLLPRLRQSLEEVVEEQIEEVEPIMDLQIALLKAAMPANDYLIHGDPAERERFAILSQAVDRAFEEALAAPYALEEERALVQAAWEEWQQARSLSEAILALPQPEGDPTAAQTMERFDAYVDRAVDRLDRLHGLAHQETGEQLAAAQADRQKGEFLTVGIFTVALGIAIAASLILAHFVLAPIHALRKAAMRFGEGDLAYRVALGRRDELGRLAQAFNAMADKIAESYAEAETRAAELAMLARVGEALNRPQTADETLRLALAEAVKLVNREQGSIILVEPETAALRIFVSVGLPPEEVRAFNARRLRADEGTFADSIGRGEMVEVTDTAAGPRVVRDYTDTFAEQLTNVPLKTAHGVIGVIALDGLPRDDRERHLLLALANLAAVAIEKVQLLEQVQRLAITDELTGLHNRRHFFELAEREFERASRYGRPLSAVMLDIDHFKRVNDTHGHAVGDQVLQALAARFRANVRDIDLLGRYGGEEFIALLPEVGLESARVAAERLRQSVAETPIGTAAGPLSVTVSLGVASAAPDCPDLPTLLRLADEALYAAKKAGRNRVCCA